MTMDYSFDAVKRIESARKIKDAAVLSEDLRPGSEAAVIQGSAADPYHVTLTSCTCPDFARTGKPCKHMYKLAIDCGALVTPKLKKKSERRFNAQAELERYKDLYTAGEIDGDVYSKIGSVLAKIK